MRIRYALIDKNFGFNEKSSDFSNNYESFFIADLFFLTSVVNLIAIVGITGKKIQILMIEGYQLTKNFIFGNMSILVTSVNF